MKVAIDISQIVHEGTGVATYVRKMVEALLRLDKKNNYVLFGSSLRKRYVFSQYFNNLKKANKNVTLVTLPVPPTILEFFWNRLHIVPAEWFVGDVDIFWSSDWAQPPLKKAKGVTTIHDLSPLKFPRETDLQIIKVHKRRLAWVAKECLAIFCDSAATKKDVEEFLGIKAERLSVIYPGL